MEENKKQREESKLVRGADIGITTGLGITVM